MKESNHKNYIHLLEACIENAKSLCDSATLLLESELNQKNKKQNQAIHAQHFLYLCLEEIGKFFLILSQYPKNLDNLNLRELGFYDHDTKIETLIVFIKKIQLQNNKASPYPINDVIKIFRNFKEPNVYIDYRKGIIKPIAKKGEDVLVNFCNVVTNSIILANLKLADFKNNFNFRG